MSKSFSITAFLISLVLHLIALGVIKLPAFDLKPVDIIHIHLARVENVQEMEPSPIAPVLEEFPKPVLETTPAHVIEPEETDILPDEPEDSIG
ncbi:MAG TPA: hypothetical protein ENN67_05585, partial [Firmicutes bacterium]|nr:hypothetical protein [Bacillota bacterium]